MTTESLSTKAAREKEAQDWYEKQPFHSDQKVWNARMAAAFAEKKVKAALASSGVQEVVEALRDLLPFARQHAKNCERECGIVPEYFSNAISRVEAALSKVSGKE